ncbi:MULTISPECIES: class I SAM-dependent methyltransferase [unclassified Methylophaga]|jgi:SAM-dependent methyltransferase|uniref:class I SAM-dependent methyltransferase n=1 Tax=unclassified Methylophaga TaxID=2629249 RepID=UPI000C962172|nr:MULTISPECIES: class I SAM-dependent methyltransferase [unclassified Methylophaga]MAK66797.1 SAM-dependent methyltransferase [Methylophaga sp.]MAY17635.1 SAM-dependent methyltransferase [Methylophaga sp.]MBN47064.1 SAM-dependent methyltransferase [Methylophaga sp.]HAO25449.1 SAM-dependent methyltransferase [Methylophaga sp.]HCD04398.1 SAM-dependent methyltransferase [Methylophaga sp.]|tara:strand:- start:106 stop:681 length:576 start_codon:yes stop_codon:yes gene_type:complete
MTGIQQKWDKRYREPVGNYPEPAWVLQQNQHLLPGHGNVVDLACGLGANALLMASLGLQVQAWDISGEALAKLSIEAERRQLDLSIEQRDVSIMPPAPESFDVIVISQFLDRPLCQHIVNALKPDGLVFYQTFCRDKPDNKGPQNPEFLLADNELLDLFASLRIRVYREEALLGDTRQGWRNQAMLVAQKS